MQILCHLHATESETLEVGLGKPFQMILMHTKVRALRQYSRSGVNRCKLTCPKGRPRFL